MEFLLGKDGEFLGKGVALSGIEVPDCFSVELKYKISPYTCTLEITCETTLTATFEAFNLNSNISSKT